MPDRLTDQLRNKSLRPEFDEAWRRQRATAAEILRRLETQEGVILADQVGMGKTYVALAVAVSKILSTPRLGQVVVLVPPAVADKWVYEWTTFQELFRTATTVRCVEAPLRSGEALLAALDAPAATRKHLLVVTHTALATTLKSSFVKIALLQAAVRGYNNAEERRWVIASCSEGRKGLFNDSSLTPERVHRLLETAPRNWRAVWHELTGQDLDDNPVPEAARAAVGRLDLSQLREVVDGLPRKRNHSYAQRLAKAREKLDQETKAIWKSVLASVELRLPLLVVDEAHRLKNPSTNFSQLFAPRSQGEGSGTLAGIFDRVLMLTATPFELGHHELIEVLSRLKAVRRPIAGVPPLDERLDRLHEALTEAQRAGLRLDEDWGRLAAADAHWFDDWSITTRAPRESPAEVRATWNSALHAVQSRRRLHQELKPWVIRHSRASRRTYLPGAAIAGGSPHQGLAIQPEMALPFLLAARAQSVAADTSQGAARPLFAYGIASSFEAFRRLNTSDRPLDSDTGPDDDVYADPESGAADDLRALHWYREEIDHLLLNGGIDRAQHPKVRATVERVVDLWWHGHKCVVFCWYIATGRAIEEALRVAAHRRVLDRARTGLRLGANATDAAVEAQLARIAGALDRDRPAYRQLAGRLASMFREAISRPGTKGADAEELVEHLVGFAVRHLRQPSYLVRYTNIRRDLRAGDWWTGANGNNPGGVDLTVRWCRFAARLADAPRDGRLRVLEALEHADLLDVRRAHGGTDRQTRERLTTTFNTPFAPDLLVASSVMGEGIDLHRECRYVVHHDLDWNPSVLEQRTGRLDRIGALSEVVGAPIQVYEPYLAGTHDEKLYRVVKDRERWFGIVMGRASGADEHTTDTEENRVPLPESIADALAMDLRTWKPPVS